MLRNRNRSATPCKCSRRHCRARRTLRRHPSDYARDPRCHIPGCDGYMRPDAHRLRARTDPAAYRSSIGELCRCGGDHNAPHVFRGGRDGNCPHRRGSIGCMFYKRRSAEA